MKLTGKIKKFGFLILPASLAILSSCMDDDEQRYEDYADWRNKNTEYIAKLEIQPDYKKVVPAWDLSSFVLIKTITSKPENTLHPLDNSTVRLKYLLTNIDGDTIDSSYKLTDSLFQCRPCDMVTGFWIATTNMCVGDSVTAVMPYTCGYGATGSGSILPYSTLIFQIKLDSIVALETLPGRLD